MTPPEALNIFTQARTILQARFDALPPPTFNALRNSDPESPHNLRVFDLRRLNILIAFARRMIARGQLTCDPEYARKARRVAEWLAHDQSLPYEVGVALFA